jgi:hypothetical protein
MIISNLKARSIRNCGSDGSRSDRSVASSLTSSDTSVEMGRRLSGVEIASLQIWRAIQQIADDG